MTDKRTDSDSQNSRKQLTEVGAVGDNVRSIGKLTGDNGAEVRTSQISESFAANNQSWQSGNGDVHGPNLYLNKGSSVCYCRLSVTVTILLSTTKEACE